MKQSSRRPPHPGTGAHHNDLLTLKCHASKHSHLGRPTQPATAHASFGFSECPTLTGAVQLSQLESFLAVTQAGTINGAAISRGLAPSSVSAQIRSVLYAASA